MLFFHNTWILIAFYKGKTGDNDQNVVLMLNYFGIYLAGGYVIAEGHKCGFHRLSVLSFFTWVTLLSVSLINI